MKQGTEQNKADQIRADWDLKSQESVSRRTHVRTYTMSFHTVTERTNEQKYIHTHTC